MKRGDTQYTACLEALQDELIPALGCTEPIALAYAAAKAVEVLGVEPEGLQVLCSGNVIKNVKGVKVPNAGDQKGVEAASILGAIGGDGSKLLEVLLGVTPAHRERTKALMGQGYCTVGILEGSENLHIQTTAIAGAHRATVEIEKEHTNIISILRDGEELYRADPAAQGATAVRAPLSFDGILDFANTVDLADVAPLLERQVAMNTAISQEGLSKPYGANVGKTLLKQYGTGIAVRARAAAAAGSDARMSGCTLPVVINSGSGNQGLTVSLPVIEYAKEYGKTTEELHRALVVSNLLSIHQKATIGKLSAYCGAVSAACGSGVAIAYLLGESSEVMKNTLKNTLGNVAGIVCDGAKPSCAAKISSAVEAALTGYLMAKAGDCFEAGDGLIVADVDQTILNYGTLAKKGMKETDQVILNMMIEQ